MSGENGISNGSGSAGEGVAAARAKLDGLRGRELWRSLEELAGTPQFEEMIRREYPSQLHKFMDLPERREFLKYMGASLALAGIGASCTRQPEEKIYPYAKSPEKTIPGKPLYYATSMPWPRGAIGLLVESHEGRPTKVEGNPEHPASLGATDAFAQAAILGLYDPDRSQAVKHRGRISTWDAFLTELNAALTAQAAKKGAGLRILTETVTSPTLAVQLKAVLALYPEAKWHQWEPVNRDNARKGAIESFGRDVSCQYRFDKADVIVSLEADFLGGGPESVRATLEFSTRRRVRAGQAGMNRLYVVESAPTVTGAMADHRLPLDPGRMDRFAQILGETIERPQEAPGGTLAPWLQAVAKDLSAHRGSSLVVCGESLVPAVHSTVHLLNKVLGNVGKTVTYADPVECESVDQRASLIELANDLRLGHVDALVIVGGNPAYDAPANVKFAEVLGLAPFRVHLSLHEEETSELCDWHINEAHFLESWGDARSSDGTTSIIQPLIAPLYGGKTAQEIMAAIAGRADLSSYAAIREHWVQGRLAGPDAEKHWRRALHDGFVADTTSRRVDSPAQGGFNSGAMHPPMGLALVFRPDPTVWDGRFANNGWLQELPKPITKLTWDNTAQVSPATAEKFGVENEDVVELELDGRKVRAPIWIVPGQVDDTVLVHLGYGRTSGGRLSEGAGFDAHELRTTNAMWSAPGLKVTKTGDKQKLSSTQEHDRMEGRDLIRVATIDRFRENPMLVDEHEGEGEGAHVDTSLYPAFPKGENSWGMVIDLNACTACSACVTACQSENNIPVVGREEVRRGREMHWIRVDRYFEGDAAHPAVHHQPIPCMHCENAPCEVVCPVGATTHSPDGLNEMTYNRCVGTRYCSNNCPYKVRRFNFLLYQDFETEVLKLGRNPDVSIRSRGVMEKCTYCVQRISEARIQAKKEDRPIRDGDIRTACQQVCPAEAITFGDIADPTTAVAKLKAQPHEYGILEELNVRPRTTYLAKLKNPNPELEG